MKVVVVTRRVNKMHAVVAIPFRCRSILLLWRLENLYLSVRQSHQDRRISVNISDASILESKNFFNAENKHTSNFNYLVGISSTPVYSTCVFEVLTC